MPLSTSVKPFVFVIMPFAKEFDDVYRLGIKAACQDAGAYCERVDEQIFTESILSRIFNQIAKADLIIADMSGRNPNVFYETGYAHALDKQVIHLTQLSDDIPFDMKHFPHVVYGNSISTLKEELTKRIRWFVDNPNRSIAQVDFQMEFFINGSKISDGQEYLVRSTSILSLKPEYANYRILDIRIDIHNPGSKSYNLAKNHFGLAIGNWKAERQILEELRIERDVREADVVLPTGENLYLASIPTEIFPNAWKSMIFESCLVNLPQKSFLRIFSELGTNDLNFILRPM